MNNSKPFPKKWILLRGLVRSRFHWKDFIENFKIGLNVNEVAPLELPGNGYYADQNTPKKIDAAVAVLKSQLQFKTEGPVGVLGISLGGMLATRWAQLQPESFSHLVVINSSSTLSPFYKRLKPINYLHILKLISNANPENIESFILKATTVSKEKWPQYLPENIEFLKNHPIKIKNFITQLQLATQADFSEVPQTQNLILTSKADKLVDSSCSEQIAKAWKAPIYIHETAGHDLSFDDSAWIINKIRDEFKI